MAGCTGMMFPCGPHHGRDVSPGEPKERHEHDIH